MISSPTRGALLRWSAVLAYLALTWWLSNRSRIPEAGHLPDVVLHSAEYSVLVCLLLRALSGGVRGPHTMVVLGTALAFSVVYGAIDEVHQSFVPGRDASVKDFLVDAAAAVLTVILVARAGAVIGRKGVRSHGIQDRGGTR